MQLNARLQVLRDEEIQAVHDKTVQLLQEKGIVFQSDAAVEIFKRHAVKTSGNTVFIDEATLDRALAQCPQTFTLEAPNPARNVTIGEGLAVHPAGGEVFISDSEGNRRTPLLQDFANLQKVYQACDHIDIAGFQPLSPTDVPERTKGMHCLISSMQHSDKPILSPMELDTVEQKRECLEMFEILFGRKGYLDDHYVTWHAVCSNSPFYYSSFASEGIQVYAEWNQPVLLVSAPMTGITSPIYLYSTVIMQMAEIMAGLVLAQLVRPGVPVVPSASLTFGNMRYASWECACPDTALMLIASTQMFKDFYHLPARAQTGVTSSKCIDYQAGMEGLQSFLLTALAGVTVCSQSVGTLENLMATSLEKTVVDDEMISRVRHILKGMETDTASMGMDILMEANPCQDFMTHPSTMDHFRDGWQPSLSDWRSYDGWKEHGGLTMLDNAKQKVKDILQAAPSSLLDPEVDQDLKTYIAKIEKN